MKRNPLIIALDFDDPDAARALVRQLGDGVDFYKVGMELYAAAGMQFARELIDAGRHVFLDLKFYDIGETVKRATAVAARSGVRFLTVHAANSIMRAAGEGRGASDFKLLAVTVLTNCNQQDVAEMGLQISFI